MSELNKKLDEYDAEFERLDKGNLLHPELMEIVKTELNPTVSKYRKYVNDNIIKLLSQQGSEDELKTNIISLDVYFNTHKDVINKLVGKTNKLIAGADEKGASVVNTYTNLLIAVAILSVVVVSFISFYFSKLILQGLGADPEELKRVTTSVAQGHLDLSIVVKKGDGSVMSAVADMVDSLKEGLARATENQRIRSALDSSSTNVMIADNERKIIYLNASVLNMLRTAEADIRAVLPHFSVEKILGSNMDIFHKNPAHQMKLLESLRTTFTSNIVVGKRHFRLVANPILSENGTRLGSVVEWLDRTQEVAVEGEVNSVVLAAGAGNFSARIPVEGKVSFFLTLAEGLNALMRTSEVGLGEVNRVLGAIAKGDLTERITADYSGTFGELKDYCNSTTDSLSDIIGEIRSAADTIFTASSEIASGNADLSSRTEQQAANLEETASSMEELTSTVKLNADNAKQANALAERASTVASDGGALIQEVVVTMSSINESSQKIADIIGVIDGIAFQTNILALNAAVEAARAGDQGRGFAVVASEVRTLAQRSANAAKDIKALISDSVKKIENGNSLVGKSGETMKEIVTSIKRVNDIMAEIAAASSEQSSGIEEVSTAVSQMDEMTQQNAALVEQAAAAAESLQSQADQLTQRVGEFKLSGDSGGTRNLGKPSARLSAPTARKLVTPTKKLSPPQNQDDEWESF
ncbi:MAG TPA: methyl-accepting chemotaxis protein [Cellvibrio sp.]|nr:methyl-accepting chemotaxis protein [Cellvibrio sp.]